MYYHYQKEARTLFNFYDTDNSGNLSFQEFVDGVMESDYGKFGAAASKSTSRWLRPSDFTIGSKIRIQFQRQGQRLLNLNYRCRYNIDNYEMGQRSSQK